MTVMWLSAARFLWGLRDFLQNKWLLGATTVSVFPCITGRLAEHNLGPAYGQQTASLTELFFSLFLTVITLKWSVRRANMTFRSA